jgi:hypothetical protein
MGQMVLQQIPGGEILSFMFSLMPLFVSVIVKGLDLV